MIKTSPLSKALRLSEEKLRILSGAAYNRGRILIMLISLKAGLSRLI
jgi:hypothetical protein